MWLCVALFFPFSRPRLRYFVFSGLDFGEFKCFHYLSKSGGIVLVYFKCQRTSLRFALAEKLYFDWIWSTQVCIAWVGAWFEWFRLHHHQSSSRHRTHKALVQTYMAVFGHFHIRTRSLDRLVHTSVYRLVNWVNNLREILETIALVLEIVLTKFDITTKYL